MYKLSSSFRVSYLRNRMFAWLLLVAFSFSFIPSASLAQQPTATINTLSGTVLVNGQEQGKGFALSAGDVIETQAGARVVLELSDESLLELGENTKVDIAELSETATGARVSRMKMAWGWIRAKLSPGHQKEGSTFNIETPNALVGVKFSQPDVEVSYDPAKQETVALALTVALAVKNLITDEEKMIPIGSMAIITALGIKIVAGAVATGAIAAEATGAGAAGTGGISTKTMAIGAGALAAAGGVALIAAGGDGDGGSASFSFTGTFVESGDDWQKTFTLQQSGDSISGTLRRDGQYNGCTCYFETTVRGQVVNSTTASLSWDAALEYCSCGGEPFGPSGYQEPGVTNRQAILENNGDILYVVDWGDFRRQ